MSFLPIYLCWEGGSILWTCLIKICVINTHSPHFPLDFFTSTTFDNQVVHFTSFRKSTSNRSFYSFRGSLSVFIKLSYFALCHPLHLWINLEVVESKIGGDAQHISCVPCKEVSMFPEVVDDVFLDVI